MEWVTYYKDQVPYYLIFIAICLVLSSYLLKIFAKYKIPISCKLILVILSSTLLLPTFDASEVISQENRYHIRIALTLLHPIIILKMTFDIDLGLLKRSVLQVLILATIGVMVNCILFSGVQSLWSDGWKTTNEMITIVSFGFTLASTDDNESHHNEREYDNLKLTYVLLQGECIVGSAICLLGLEMCLTFFDGQIMDWYHMIDYMIQHIVGGIIFGGIVGKSMSFCAVQMFNEPLNVAIFVMAGVYTTYYISEFFLFTSSTIATFIVAFSILKQRSELSEATYVLLNHAIHFFYDKIFLTISIRYIIGVSIQASKFLEASHIVQYLLTYVVGCVGRFATLTIAAPFLLKTGPGIKLRNLLALFWLVKKGTLQMMFFALVFQHKIPHSILQSYCGHIYTIILLSLLINGITEVMVLRIFGLIGISHGKNAHMAECVKYVYAQKENFISSIKMNRMYLYVDWKRVEELTKIDDLILSTVGETTQDSQVKSRVYYCGDCRREVILPPTKKELQHISMEAKSRCLELHKISFIRQAEHGIISNESKTLLIYLLECAKESEMKDINIKRMLKGFRKKHWPEKIQMILYEFKLELDYPRPRMPFRKLCYDITMNKCYELVIFVYLLSSYIYTRIWGHSRWTDLLNIAVFGAHFFLKIQAYSHIYLKNGIKLFFQNHWNIFDFMILVTAILVTILQEVISLKKSDDSVNISYFTLLTITMLKAIRFLKVLSVVYKFKKEIICFCDKMILIRVGTAMDMSQGLVNSLDEILHMLPEIIENEIVRQELTLKFVEDKKEFINFINETQKNTYWIAVAVKTKRAIRRAFYVMHRTLIDFKQKGLLGEVELAKLRTAHETCVKNSLGLRRVPLNTPENIFSELPWMYNQRDFSDLFFSYGIPLKWKPKESICGDGFVTPGVYVIVEGMVLLKYNPANIEELAGIGALPCKDYIFDLEFMTPGSITLIPGNTFGEISVMTRRPNHCNAIAEVPTKGYFIPIFMFSQILSMKGTLEASRLYSSIWKYISQNLCSWLLWNQPIHKNMLREDAIFFFMKGFAPNMSGCNFFVATDLIEDIVLVEGKVEDLHTGEVFLGPRYLRRSSTHLLLIEDNGITPLLFILPLKDEYTERILTTILQSSAIAIQTLERRFPSAIEDSTPSLSKLFRRPRDSKELIKEKFRKRGTLNKISEDPIQSVPSGTIRAVKKHTHWSAVKFTDNSSVHKYDNSLLMDFEWHSDEDIKRESREANLEDSKLTIEIEELDEFSMEDNSSGESAAIEKDRKKEVKSFNRMTRDDIRNSNNLVQVVKKILQQ